MKRQLGSSIRPRLFISTVSARWFAAHVFALFIAATAMAGCTQSSGGHGQPTKSDSRATVDGTAVPAFTPTTAVEGDHPGEIVRDAQVWSGPGADAVPLGVRQAGTSVMVHEIVGQRAHVYERYDANLASWLDLSDLALSLEAWTRLRPSPVRTTIAIAAPSAKTVTLAMWGHLPREAGSFLQRFLEVGSPGADLLVRTGYGSMAPRIDIAIPSLVKPQMTEPGPKPSVWDSPAYNAWKKRMEQRQRQEQEYSNMVVKVGRDAEVQIADLKKFQLPVEASVARAVLQIERELRQVRAPAVNVVLVMNPAREPIPTEPLPELKGIRASLVVACDADEGACREGETKWQRLLSQAGVLGEPRIVDVQSTHLSQAFEPIVPVIR